MDMDEKQLDAFKAEIREGFKKTLRSIHLSNIGEESAVLKAVLLVHGVPLGELFVEACKEWIKETEESDV